jgi:hypothetical protein
VRAVKLSKMGLFQVNSVASKEEVYQQIKVAVDGTFEKMGQNP